ncbi:hypothetical protein [Flavisolibacter ginsenosidimutans]|uniref:Uncharacterized protein n=1 Tax=Flavisolibacter ginsenosidimutans TaxID=661481 RepID=A0A5B8UGQ7_9BACT|nr:hypothetical protein [Flavisolibacter ginsenosidimutans]QEC55506.1 hypothetical protein FSB75_06175 [Flavisolibacter ginsenosidimutans]
MGSYIQTILDWAEVWTLLIPIYYFFRAEKKAEYMRWVSIYIFAAFIINLLGDIISDYGKQLGFPHWLQRNVFLYNVHSVIRFILFSSFFNSLNQPLFKTAKRIIPFVSIPAVIIYFWRFENFNNQEHISGYFLAAEAFLLLLYCMQYYLNRIKEESTFTAKEPNFWVATGLSIYVVINFFVFLFYIPVLNENSGIADRLWSIHNLAYITFSIFLAKAYALC